MKYRYQNLETGELYKTAAGALLSALASVIKIPKLRVQKMFRFKKGEF